MSRRVVLHVGEPKCGTTFLQGIAWSNRAALAAAGIVLPGGHVQDHYRAAQDLRGVQSADDDPRGSWEGAWDLLAAQARSAPGTVLISHEMLSGVPREAADRAIASLGAARIDVVVTVRDWASLLPAEWQETVKHRNTTPFPRWLRQVIDAPVKRGRAAWFWAAHDTMDVLDRWGHTLPPENVHVIPVPRPGSPPTLLWERFAAVLGVPADLVDASAARPNESLGLAETEMLRRLNRNLAGQLPPWFYADRVKEVIAHRTLAQRPDKVRLRLPAARAEWANARSDRLIADLRASGYTVVGDLDELRPRPASGRPARPRDVTDAQLLAASLDAVGALLVDELRALQTDGSGPWRRVKAGVRALTTRRDVLRRARVLVWRLRQRGGSTQRRRDG